MLSLDIVLAALPEPLRQVLENPRVTELMINSPDAVFCEIEGCLRPVDADGLTARKLESTSKRIAHPLGLNVGARSPIVDARLPDGSRVAIACPPISETYALSIRRFSSKPWSAQMLVQAGSLPAEVLECAQQALDQRHNILISGGTGTGKTTMLSALAALIDTQERVVSIEDTRELKIAAPNCLSLEAKNSRKEKEGGPVTIRDLVRHALRHRPDRLIVGEVRGAEADDLIQALNTGHGGSISTVHANSARAALTRLATCALQSDASLPWNVVCELVALAVKLVIHLERSSDGRRFVKQVLQVHRYNQARGDFDYSLLFHSGASEEETTLHETVEATVQDDASPAGEFLRCLQCEAEFPVSKRGPRSLLCKKCRKREQNKRSYERRVAQGGV